MRRHPALPPASALPPLTTRPERTHAGRTSPFLRDPFYPQSPARGYEAAHDATRPSPASSPRRHRTGSMASAHNAHRPVSRAAAPHTTPPPIHRVHRAVSAGDRCRLRCSRNPAGERQRIGARGTHHCPPVSGGACRACKHRDYCSGSPPRDGTAGIRVKRCWPTLHTRAPHLRTDPRVGRKPAS